MSGPFEKYVEQAAEAINAFWLPNRGVDSEPTEADDALARAVLATVGPLIAEDTRERMVAAAGAALERESGGQP